MEKNQIFNKESLDRITSPEELNSIIKVAQPGVWILVVAIIILLIGALFWCFFGKMESSVDTAVIVKDNVVYAFVKEDSLNKIQVNNTINFNGNQCVINSIDSKPYQIDYNNPLFNLTDFEYSMHLLELNEGDWVYCIQVSSELENGVYSGRIITESISPVKFIFN